MRVVAIIALLVVRGLGRGVHLGSILLDVFSLRIFLSGGRVFLNILYYLMLNSGGIRNDIDLLVLCSGKLLGLGFFLGLGALGLFLLLLLLLLCLGSGVKSGLVSKGEIFSSNNDRDEECCKLLVIGSHASYLQT